MKERFDYKKANVRVNDFLSSIDRLSNAIMVLNTYYNLCFQDYNDFWRINALIEALVNENDFVMEEAEKVRELFLD